MKTFSDTAQTAKFGISRVTFILGALLHPSLLCDRLRIRLPPRPARPVAAAEVGPLGEPTTHARHQRTVSPVICLILASATAFLLPFLPPRSITHATPCLSSSPAQCESTLISCCCRGGLTSLVVYKPFCYLCQVSSARIPYYSSMVILLRPHLNSAHRESVLTPHPRQKSA